MKKYWVIAPYDSTQKNIFNSVWEYDLKNNRIAIGWDELGDVSKLNKKDLKITYQKVYPHNNQKPIMSRDINVLWAFYHDIKQGDIIIARCGTKKIIGIGTVMDSAFFDREAGRERVVDKNAYQYSNFIPVKWEKVEKIFEKIVFSFYTMYEIYEEKYNELLNDNENSDTERTENVEFILEKYLEDFLITNFDKIFGSEFELYRDPEGNIGQQYPAITDNGDIIGRIDILAKEKKTKDFVIIELKKGRESDVVVGQILRYIGWANEHLCNNNENTKGIIVCKDIDQRLIYALKPVDKIIQVRKYKIDFELIDSKN